MKKNRLLFLVDDDEILVETMSKFLGREFGHYELKSFNTGEECLNNIDLKPNIIILDYSLDSINENAMNGLDVLKKIKKKSKQTEVIFLTKKDSTEFAKVCLESGASDYVIKNDTSHAHLLLGLKNLSRKIKAQDEARVSRNTSLWALGVVFGITIMYLIIWLLFLNK